MSNEQIIVSLPQQAHAVYLEMKAKQAHLDDYDRCGDERDAAWARVNAKYQSLRQAYRALYDQLTLAQVVEMDRIHLGHLTRQRIRDMNEYLCEARSSNPSEQQMDFLLGELRESYPRYRNLSAVFR